jgi:hypothetical protein
MCRSEMLTLPLRAAPPRRCANSDMMSVLCGDPGITLSRRIVALTLPRRIVVADAEGRRRFQRRTA